ncbi:hypothetical protein [Flagellimonas aequoris]|uniref:Uncharacterized protein n=1 Tax=Flagellimonas aequoris TaxID=2306997 RepID=A0A418N4J9_9FLAO|nr:hypothetical protein [Allomuricauda aequoris]RIV68713.1 hypothetical protein D2U88_16115 [Allomuricauda aequoris]TXK00412.1 hypothetical protein FQ019_15935 [Allomuricauda aequoris]
MGWNNNNNWNGNRGGNWNGNRGGNWNGNRGGNWNGNGGNMQPPPKRSGAKYSTIKTGKFKGATIVNAWNKSKGKGLITAKVAPYKDSKEYTAKSTGNVFITMIAEVFYHNSGQKMLIPCSMNKDTKVIVLSDIGMTITPNGHGVTSGGKRVTGYFGKFTR